MNIGQQRRMGKAMVAHGQTVFVRELGEVYKTCTLSHSLVLSNCFPNYVVQFGPGSEPYNDIKVEEYHGAR